MAQREQALGTKTTQGLGRCKLAICNLNLQAPMKIGGLADLGFPYSPKRGLGDLHEPIPPLIIYRLSQVWEPMPSKNK